jgi:hypothetical protein
VRTLEAEGSADTLPVRTHEEKVTMTGKLPARTRLQGWRLGRAAEFCRLKYLIFLLIYTSLNFYFLLYWGYIVVFLKVLTIYQT